MSDCPHGYNNGEDCPECEPVTGLCIPVDASYLAASVAERDIARKESAALALLLEQERARSAGIQYCEECNSFLSACGEQNPDGTPSMDCRVCRLRSLLEKERAKCAALVADWRIEAYENMERLAKNTNLHSAIEVFRDRDELRAKVTALEKDRDAKVAHIRLFQIDEDKLLSDRDSLRATVAALQQRCAKLEGALTLLSSARFGTRKIAREALAPDSAFQQGGDAKCSVDAQTAAPITPTGDAATQTSSKGALTFDPKAAPDASAGYYDAEAFLREYKEGKHPLSSEDEAALEAAAPALLKRIKAILSAAERDA